MKGLRKLPDYSEVPSLLTQLAVRGRLKRNFVERRSSLKRDLLSKAKTRERTVAPVRRDTERAAEIETERGE